MTDKPTWGGPRPNSGRPKIEGATRLTVLVTPEQLAALDAYATEIGATRSAALRQYLDGLRSIYRAP